MSPDSKPTISRLPLTTRRLGRLQEHLWDSDPKWFGCGSWLGDRVSSLRYWLWFITGGWKA